MESLMEGINPLGGRSSGLSKSQFLNDLFNFFGFSAMLETPFPKKIGG